MPMIDTFTLLLIFNFHSSGVGINANMKSVKMLQAESNLCQLPNNLSQDIGKLGLPALVYANA